MKWTKRLIFPAGYLPVAKDQDTGLSDSARQGRKARTDRPSPRRQDGQGRAPSTALTILEANNTVGNYEAGTDIRAALFTS